MVEIPYTVSYQIMEYLRREANMIDIYMVFRTVKNNNGSLSEKYYYVDSYKARRFYRRSKKEWDAKIVMIPGVKYKDNYYILDRINEVEIVE